MATDASSCKCSIDDVLGSIPKPQQALIDRAAIALWRQRLYRRLWKPRKAITLLKFALSRRTPGVHSESNQVFSASQSPGDVSSRAWLLAVGPNAPLGQDIPANQGNTSESKKNQKLSETPGLRAAQSARNMARITEFPFALSRGSEGHVEVGHTAAESLEGPTGPVQAPTSA